VVPLLLIAASCRCCIRRLLSMTNCEHCLLLLPLPLLLLLLP
jgi:hypothetical protein